MNRKLLFVFSFIIAIGGTAVGQTRSVTNSDLEKYRHERLKAEAELRENYAKLGFPSPEELERRREASRIETEKLSEKLREERLDRERFEAERRAMTVRNNIFALPFAGDTVQTGIYTGYYLQNRRGYRRPIIRSQQGQTGYYAGGQFWPVPQRPRFVPRSVWTPRPR